MKLNKKIVLAFLATTLYSFTGVFAAGIDHFEVDFTPKSAKVGESLDLTIEAVDKNNEIVTDYDGTILIFSESDPEADLPSALKENTYTFSASDQGKIKFENSVIFKSAGLQSISIYDLNDDSVFGIAEAELEQGDVKTNLDIEIISPENGLTVGKNSIGVSGATKKNHTVKIMVNGKEFSTTSNNDGIFEKTVDNLSDGENKIKAVIFDADGKNIGESEEVKIKVELDSLNIKNVSVTPKSIDSENTYIVEVITNPKLVEVNVIVNDVLTKLSETKPGIYTAKLFGEKEPGTYKIDVTLEDELGHEKTEIGAGSIIIKEIELTSAQTDDVEDKVVDPKACYTKEELKISGLKLVELKTKSILTWDKVQNIKNYNVYKKLDDGKLELITNVTTPKFEINITGEETKYTLFAVKAVNNENCGDVFEGTLSDATKVKTGPEAVLLFVLSLLIGGAILISKQRRA